MPAAMVLPVGEGARKRRVAPALRNPRRVTDDAQRPQRLHEIERAAIEVAHRLVAVDEQRPLPLRLVVAPRRQQPQVRHRRPGREVVESEEEEPRRPPQQIATQPDALLTGHLGIDPLTRATYLYD